MRFEISRASRNRPPDHPIPGAFQVPPKTDEFDPWYVELEAVADLVALAERLGVKAHEQPAFVVDTHAKSVLIYDSYIE